VTGPPIGLLDPSLPEAAELVLALRRIGEPVRRVGAAPVAGVEPRLLRRGFEANISSALRAAPALWLESPQVVHAFGPPLGYLAGRWSRHTGKPAIVTLAGTPTRRWLLARRGRLALVVGALRGCAGCVVSSRAAADALWRALGAEAKVIAPGIDVTRFPPQPTASPSPTVAHPASRPSAAVRGALQLLRGQLDDVQLVSAAPGAGPGNAWVTLLSGEPADDPLSALRSLVAGRPVVVPRGRGAAEVIDRAEIGALADREEPGPLCAALRQAIELHGQTGTAGACRARAEEFSVEAWARSYQRLYQAARA
jgi:glycosyltransferase involved in cell wall biosynthesis